jgi:hypothetical protein
MMGTGSKWELPGEALGCKDPKERREHRGYKDLQELQEHRGYKELVLKDSKDYKGQEPQEE